MQRGHGAGDVGEAAQRSVQRCIGRGQRRDRKVSDCVLKKLSTTQPDDTGEKNQSDLPGAECPETWRHDRCVGRTRLAHKLSAEYREDVSRREIITPKPMDVDKVQADLNWWDNDLKEESNNHEKGQEQDENQIDFVGKGQGKDEGNREAEARAASGMCTGRCDCKGTKEAGRFPKEGVREPFDTGLPERGDPEGAGSEARDRRSRRFIHRSHRDRGGEHALADTYAQEQEVQRTDLQDASLIEGCDGQEFSGYLQRMRTTVRRTCVMDRL